MADWTVHHLSGVALRQLGSDRQTQPGAHRRPASVNLASISNRR
jgi:hypothetical protein